WKLFVLFQTLFLSSRVKKIEYRARINVSCHTIRLFPPFLLHEQRLRHICFQPFSMTFQTKPVNRPSHPLPIWHSSRIFMAYLAHFFAHSSSRQTTPMALYHGPTSSDP